jgi:hypothetical protein
MSDPVVVTIQSNVLQEASERIGLNVMAQDTGAGTILKNMAWNPGFENAVWNSIIHTDGTTSAGRMVQAFWDTSWNVPGSIGWPEGLFDGGTYRVLTGANAGATGTITSFVFEANQPVFYISDEGLTLDNWTAVHVSVAQTLPNGGEPRTGSPGLRSTQIAASDPIWQASYIQYWDSFRRDFDASAPLFIQLEGEWRVSFWAKGPANVRTRLERSGLVPALDQTVAVGADWEELVFDLSLADGTDSDPFGLNNGLMSLSIYTDAAFLIDDLFVGKTSDTNPTVFNDAFVNRLKEYNPGMLRDWSNQLGSTYATQIADPYARGPQGWTQRVAYAYTYSFGLLDFLALCAEVGCDPWYVIPPTWTPAEMVSLDALLQTSVAESFTKIHLEYGNEMWGAASGSDPFFGASALGGVNLANMADAAFASLSADARYNRIIGGQFYWPGRQDEINNASNYDEIALAPYFGITGEEADLDQLYHSLFARAVDDVTNGKVAQSAVYESSLAVYEINFHTLLPAGEYKDNFVRGRGGALALAFFCLQYMKFMGMKNLCPFGSLQFSTVYATVLTPIWGMLRDVTQKRPTWLGAELANSAIAGNLVATTHSDESGVVVPAINEVSEETLLKYLHSFAFKDGDDYYVVLFNFSQAAILTEVNVGTDSLNWTCRGIWGDYAEHNDAVVPEVEIETLEPVGATARYELPAQGMYVLTSGDPLEPETQTQTEGDWMMLYDDLKDELLQAAGKILKAANVGWLFGWGAAVPADSTAGYAKGALFIHHDAETADDILYVNTGTVELSTFRKLRDVSLGLTPTISGIWTFGSSPETSVVAGIGSIGSVEDVTGLTVKEYGTGAYHTTVFTFADVDLELTDEAGVVAWGGKQIYNFPAGFIYIMSAMVDLALTKSSAGVNADWDGDVGVGTTIADNDASLATTEQDIIPTTATPQAVTGATTAKAQSTATEQAILDGHTTPKDLFLNLLVDDLDHDVGGTPCNLILNGSLVINWLAMGDN